MNSETWAARSRLAILLAVVFVAQARGQTTERSIDVDPRAALVEVIVPPEVLQSPGAVGLTERLVRDHAIMLEQPGLTIQVLQNPNISGPEVRRKVGTVSRIREAVYARTIDGSNLVELFVDPEICGEGEAAKLAEGIVDQHIENQKRQATDEALEQSVRLKDLKQKYELRRDEIVRDLRERVTLLHTDGMGTPGRFGPKELELNKLIELRLELERKKLDATPDAAKAIDVQLEELQVRVTGAKNDLAGLTNAYEEYVVLKDEAQEYREKIRDVNERLDKLWRNTDALKAPVRWVQKPLKGE